ncbi:hypothetical protein GGF32_003797 [Allomyces javanicus]|nr:hypothetical protein GGF32_003797 [Allomyces javanicus]
MELTNKKTVLCYLFHQVPPTLVSLKIMDTDLFYGESLRVAKALTSLGTVEDSGMIGYAAKISWYINAAIANANPSLI